MYFVFACSLMVQWKNVIIPDGPYGSGTIRVSRPTKYDYSKCINRKQHGLPFPV